MAHLSSDKIKVFPCSGRSAVCDPTARLSTEYNLVSIINRLVDKKSFIVTTYHPYYVVDNAYDEFVFNIGGYLFVVPQGSGAKAIIDTAANDRGTNSYIIATINPQIVSDDKNSSYQALCPTEWNITAQSPSITVSTSQAESTPDPLTDVDTDEAVEHTYTTGVLDYTQNENPTAADYNFLGVIFSLASSIPNPIDPMTQLVLFEYINNLGWIEYEDSKVKFETTITGHRSVRIDDGILYGEGLLNVSSPITATSPSVAVTININNTAASNNQIIWKSSNPAMYTLEYNTTNSKWQIKCTKNGSGVFETGYIVVYLKEDPAVYAKIEIKV